MRFGLLILDLLDTALQDGSDSRGDVCSPKVVDRAGAPSCAQFKAASA